MDSQGKAGCAEERLGWTQFSMGILVAIEIELGRQGAENGLDSQLGFLKMQN